MRISAREACVKPHLRTRSDIKAIIPNFSLKRLRSLARWLKAAEQISTQSFFSTAVCIVYSALTCNITVR